jgi:hypothetical protein
VSCSVCIGQPRPQDQMTKCCPVKIRGRTQGERRRAGLASRAGRVYWLPAVPTEPFNPRPITPVAPERGFCLFAISAVVCGCV